VNYKIVKHEAFSTKYAPEMFFNRRMARSYRS